MPRSKGDSNSRPRTIATAPAPAPPRVVIEHVRPEVDGGRFPIKRTVGETVRVEANVHADGHDSLAVVLRYRQVDAAGVFPWLETPMEALGNDAWTASFRVDGVGRYQFTIAAWVDRFETWRRE